METNPLRRFEDRSVTLLRAGIPEAPSTNDAPAGRLEIEAFEFHPERAEKPARISVRSAEEAEDAMVLLDSGADDLILVTGAELRRIPRPSGDAPLFDTIEEEAVAVRRRRLRAIRRQQLTERFLLLSERLNRCATVDAVVDAVVQHAPRIVGGFDAMVFLHRGRALDGDGPLFAAPHPRIAVDLEPLPIETGDPTTALGVITPADVLHSGPFAALEPLFRETGAEKLAFVALGEAGLLLLIERRREREFEGEDWYRLQSVAHEATAALERIRLSEDVRTLGLTDPETGVGNRRKLEAILSHALAGVGRGIPLTLAAVAPRNVGNGAPDRVAGLRAFALSLAHSVRASDVVVRYDDNRFLIVLAGTEVGGADALGHRLEQTSPAPGLRFARVACASEAAAPREIVQAALDLL